MSFSKTGTKAPPTTEQAFAICERVAEVQAPLYDHIECGKHASADVDVKAQAVLSEAELLQAIFDVGYFPPKPPPDD
jgi:hypothetical protein